MERKCTALEPRGGGVEQQQQTASSWQQVVIGARGRVVRLAIQADAVALLLQKPVTAHAQILLEALLICAAATCCDGMSVQPSKSATAQFCCTL